MSCQALLRSDRQCEDAAPRYKNETPERDRGSLRGVSTVELHGALLGIDPVYRFDESTARSVFDQRYAASQSMTCIMQTPQDPFVSV
jgi:hypothetical protein